MRQSRHDGGIPGSPLLYQGVVYIGAGSKLYALNVSDGSLRWVKALTEGVPIVGAPITDGTNLYLTANSGSLYAVQLVDGAVVWQRSLGGQPLLLTLLPL